MLNLTETAIRLYRQIFTSPELAGQLADGIETVMDGNTAVAVTEACLSNVAVSGGGFLQQSAALVWLSEQQRVTTNLFGEKLSIQHADSPRGALSSAMGVSMSGQRSTVFLAAQDLMTCQDLLHMAVGRNLPLVIHLDNRLSAMQANTTGSGHDAVHQAMDSGCVVLFASNVQQAVDFTLIARHVAEITLTPALVVMDGVETALAVQDVRLPSAELVKQFIGRADEMIESPSVAQKQLFSTHRPRLPRWHDLDKPVLQGAMQEAHIYALGSAARQTYFDELIALTLDNAFSSYAQLTGRHYSCLSTYALEKADIIVIAQGSAIESVQTFSAFLSNQKHNNKNLAALEKVNLGVIGLHSLRPFNPAKLVEILNNNPCSTRQVVVLERMNVPLASDAPLMREIRAAIQQQREQESFSAGRAQSRSTKKTIFTDFPQLHSIIYGLGGVNLNLADLAELIKQIKSHAAGETSLTARYLGIAFNAHPGTRTDYPKRQVMLDTLQRYYPQISTLGINAQEKQLPFCSAQSTLKTHGNILSVAISHLTGSGGNSAYAMDLSAFIYKLKGHYLRSFIAPSSGSWATRQTDYIIQSDQPCNTGNSCRVDFLLLLSADAASLLSACKLLNDHGVLIFSSRLPPAAVADKAMADGLTLIKNRQLTLYQISTPGETKTEKTATDDYRAGSPASDRHHLDQHRIDQHSSEQTGPDEISVNELLWEKMLATLTGLLLHANRLNNRTRKIISARQTGLSTASDHASVQKQERLGDMFKSTLNAVLENLTPFDSDRLSVGSVCDENINTATNPAISIPPMVKQLGQAGDTYDSLPRFWDQVGVLQQAGESAQLTADPYLATGTLPSLTATFNDISPYRHALNGSEPCSEPSDVPVFMPQNCTACGLCWSNCPDSAIATVAISPRALIETGIRLTGADALRQVTSKLASRIARRCRNREIAVNSAGELLGDAFDWLKEKSGLPAERLQSIEADFEQASAAISDLPVVTSELLFYSQEQQQNDSGELFSLVINPDSCKACGLCIELCASRDETPALSHENIETQNHNSTRLREQWQLWQQTPDTSSSTIERIIRDQSMGAGAALMLSRHSAFSLSGGDHGEPASGEKIALRQILSATEYHQQPLLHRFVTELEQLRDELKQEINASLSEALPTDNLLQLSEKLSDVSTRQVDLNVLLASTTQDNPQSISATIQNTAVDAVRTSQLVELVIQINALLWKLSTGAYGLGRARYSLCLTSGSIASWAGSFPHNPFHVPVNIDITGESAQLAAGLVQGQVREFLLSVSLMRQARASIDARYAKETESLERLDWTDLTEAEKQLCPPLWLVGGDDLLGTQGLSQISLLLNSDCPLKIVIFSELDSGLAYEALHDYQLNRRTDSRNHLAMLALSQRNAYVAQTSIADNTHLQRSVHELLSSNTPGLLCVHTPSPERHGFKPEHTLRQAQLAVNSRMFPLFRYNPAAEGVFGSRISLEGNDETTSLTPAHWAIHEQRFQAHFSVLEVNAAFPVELSDWLDLTPSEQKKNTPFVSVSLSDQADEDKMAVSKAFAMMVVEQRDHWRTLQELAGIVTPFTDYVEQCVEQRLRAEHQAELDALKTEYEVKLAQLEASYQHQTHTRIRNQLLGLAGYDVSNLPE